MNAPHFLLACTFAALCAACQCGEDGTDPPHHEGPDVVLRGRWNPEPPGDGMAGLELRVSGDPVNGVQSSIRVWIMDETFDPETFDPSTGPQPVLSAQEEFPWHVDAPDVPYVEGAKPRTIYALVENANGKFDGLATVPSGSAAELFEYLPPIPTDTTTNMQPDVTGRTGFEEVGTTGVVIFHLDGQGDGLEVKFKVSDASGHTFDEIWIWRFTSEGPAWPVPPRSEELHHASLGSAQREHIVDTDFTNNATNGTCAMNADVWLYAMARVDDDSEAPKYWQYRMMFPVKADPARDPNSQQWHWERKRNPTGTVPR